MKILRLKITGKREENLCVYSTIYLPKKTNIINLDLFEKEGKMLEKSNIIYSEKGNAEEKTWERLEESLEAGEYLIGVICPTKEDFNLADNFLLKIQIENLTILEIYQQLMNLHYETKKYIDQSIEIPVVTEDKMEKLQMDMQYSQLAKELEEAKEELIKQGDLIKKLKSTNSELYSKLRYAENYIDYLKNM